jgi:hypothetical protein
MDNALVITGLYFYQSSLKPPLPYISPEDRHEFLKRFYRDVEGD